MKKILSYLVVFIVGVAMGCSGYWFVTVKQPELHAYKEAVKEQEKLYDMFYTGRVLEVSPKSLLIQVTQRGGEDVESAEPINVQFTNETTIQEGMNFLNRPGMELDLTLYVEPGMLVDVLVDEGQALALHYDRMPGQ